MSEPQAPAGARWNTPGWGEAEFDDSAEVAALKAALESATRRAEEWQEGHDRLWAECAAHTREIKKLEELNQQHFNSQSAQSRETFQWGLGFGALAVLALYGALAWFGYV